MNATVDFQAPQTALRVKDYATDQDVRWCPGCGDYAILKAVQKTLADVAADPAQTVFVSGIGCASRFPYYMATYGFHTIHGRAPAIATGIKLANPELDVWVVTGDGDGLSIGGNHLLHVLRRNVDVQVLLFNNAVYGLTKGQYSPTSQPGMKSPSSPRGAFEAPAHPAQFALGAGSHFIARAVDTMAKHLPEVLKRARAHRGAAFVEILQNCIVYNDGVFKEFTEKKAQNKQLLLEHGKPMLFGAEQQYGLRLNPRILALETVTLGQDGITLDDILLHDETNPTLAYMLAQLADPLPLGVIYCNPAASFEQQMQQQAVSHSSQVNGDAINALLRRGKTWLV